MRLDLRFRFSDTRKAPQQFAGDCSIAVRRRGNVYLRKILIHRPRAAMGLFKRDRVPIGAWLDRLDARAHKNVVVIAIANKLARIAWAVLSSGIEHRPGTVPAW